MKFYRYLLILLVIQQKAYSQSNASIKTAFSLKEAQAYAIEHSYISRNQQYDVQQAEQQVREYTSIGLPQISLQGSYNQFVEIPTSVLPNFIGPAITGALVQAGALPPSALNQKPDPEFIFAQFGTKYQVQGGVQGSQLLFDGSFFVGLQAAKAYVDLTKSQQQKNNLDINESVAKAYATVLIVQESRKVLEASLQQAEKIKLETDALFKSGFAEESDVDQFDITINSIKNQIETNKRNEENAKALLKFSMGLNIKEEISLSDNLDYLTTWANNAPSDKKFDPTSSIDYMLLTKTERLMYLNMKREKIGYLPSARLIGNASTQALRNEFDLFDTKQRWFPTILWGFNINMPLFDGFGRDARVKKAKLDVLKIQNNKEQASQGLILAVEKATNDLITSDTNLKNEQKNIELATKLRDKAIIKYKEGVGSSLEVTQMESQLSQAQGNYYRLLFEKINAKTALDKLIGNNQN